MTQRAGSFFMIDRFLRVATPVRLTELNSDSILRSRFPLGELLRNSLFYPSSAFDGDPVKHLAGYIHSFIYVDYGHTEGELLEVLKTRGFSGYEPIATRSVTEQELTPNGWTPQAPNHLDGDQTRYRDWWIKQPFCLWTVFQRCDDRPHSHGPVRFSLLYLCADGAAAYQALYIANAIAPKAIAVIQPGHSFGGNWTNFEDPQQILARTVAANPAGKPEFLLYGGYGSRDYYRQPCWPEYSEHVCFLDKHDGGTIGLWRLKPE
jgi:hypothetical protein